MVLAIKGVYINKNLELIIDEVVGKYDKIQIIFNLRE